MTLINITLDEAAQNLLLRHASCYPDHGPWADIAKSIRRAREDVWAMNLESNEAH